MRDTVIGFVLAALFIGAMVFGGIYIKHDAPKPYAETPGEVTSGFVGMKVYDGWQLLCGKPTAADQASSSSGGIPLSLTPGKPAPGAGNALRRCRASLFIRRKDNPKALLLAVSFRHTADSDKLALIIRFPLLAKKGDLLGMQLDQKGGLKLPVNDCGQEGCLAAGLLSPDVQAMLMATKRAVLVFPAKKDGKPLGMLIPFTGLRDALTAMAKAES
jgi:invasion protein IalB